MSEKDQLFPISIEEELKRSYLEYAMSVIVGRALPDVRDGLKPVHRRVLFAMHDTGNFAEKPYRKSARAVGTVIGRFHPHGDSAVYDTIVRMAQDFSMRHPLIDGQGNFGSIDGDRAAAMRYTEVKLTRLAHQMLGDIEKETVDFGSTYDGSEEEPLVLPAAFPNLLVNGAAGIAVGMATNIPPHNLGEICDAIAYLVENPQCTWEDLIQIVPGPDFPTAGYIHGTMGIRQAYSTGRGRIKMRGKMDIEPHPSKKDQDIILITELPFQVNKAQLIEDIAHLVRDKRIEGIRDIRDESDRDGIRVVVEMKRGENASVILNQLYKFTKLESTFGVISLAIVHGRPQVLPIKQMLQHFVDFRREVIVRRTTFDLRKAEERSHILEGLKIAIDNLDEVISIVRGSKTPLDAKEALRLRFQFSDKQAQAILDMRLHRLTGLERQKIVDEYDEIQRKIASLREILASQSLQLKIVVDELRVIQEKFGNARRTQIMPDMDEISIEDLIEDRPVVITLSHTGYIKRTALSTYRAQGRGGKGRKGMTTRAEDAVAQLFVASTHDYILVFTSAGRMHWLKVHAIPEVGTAGRGKPVVNLIQIGPDEQVRALLRTREFPEDQYVVLASRRGYIKKTALSAFSRVRASGIIAVHLDDGDDVLDAGISHGDSEIFLATAEGKSIRFKESDVRAMGRSARGVKAIRMAENDRLVGMSVLKGRTDILTVTENGYGKRTVIDEYRLQGRSGSGIINIRTSTRNGKVVAVRDVDEVDNLLIITREGKIIRMNVSDISCIGRATQGVRLIDIGKDDAVVDAIRTAERDDEETDELDDGAETPETPEIPET